MLPCVREDTISTMKKTNFRSFLHLHCIFFKENTHGKIICLYFLLQSFNFAIISKDSKTSRSLASKQHYITTAEFLSKTRFGQIVFHRRKSVIHSGHRNQMTNTIILVNNNNV